MDKLRAELEALIQTIIAPHDEEAAKYTAEEYFESIDSIRFIELIVGVENKYGIEFCNEDLLTYKEKSFDEFADSVGKYVFEKSAAQNSLV